MKLEERYTAVYKHRPGEPENTVSYFIIQHKTDCVICLDFHTNPQVLGCGHVLCAACLHLTRLHFGACPMCFNPIADFYKVQWTFLDDLETNTTITLVLVRFRPGDNVENYHKNPFSLFYYEHGKRDEKTGAVFYQQSNGAPYYLSPVLTEKMKKRRMMPENIHTRVLRITGKIIGHRENTLPHLPFGKKVFYVDVRL